MVGLLDAGYWMGEYGNGIRDMNKKFTVACFLLIMVFMVTGCGSKFSSLLSQSWSENYALAAYGSEASHPEINDGKIDTWGVTQPPDRVYTITLSEEKEVHRILIYGGNIISYKLFCWDGRNGKWKLAGEVKDARIKKLVNYERLRTEVYTFDHRIKFKTSKIKLQVDKTKSDNINTTRTPGKNDKVINRREENIGGLRIILYDVFVPGAATVREIKAYGHREKSEIE
jgi:hypothetical protein